jgi:hypothetical protein
LFGFDGCNPWPTWLHLLWWLQGLLGRQLPLLAALLLMPHPPRLPPRLHLCCGGRLLLCPLHC